MEGGSTSTIAVITEVALVATPCRPVVIAVITAIVPIALGIFAMVWIVRKATKWFKGMTQ